MNTSSGWCSYYNELILIIEIFVIVLLIAHKINCSVWMTVSLCHRRWLRRTVLVPLCVSQTCIRRCSVEDTSPCSPWTPNSAGKASVRAVLAWLPSPQNGNRNGSFYRTHICFSVSSWIHLVSLNALNCYESMVCHSVSKELDPSMCILYSYCVIQHIQQVYIILGMYYE